MRPQSARLSLCLLTYFAGLFLAISSALAAEETLSDQLKEILTPAPSGRGESLSPTYQDYLPEVVFFKSAPKPPPSPFKIKQLKSKGLEATPPPRPTVFGRLYLPEGEGPFPAVVLLSAPLGISIWDDAWAARLMSWGYGVLDVDSLTPRGLYPHNSGSGATLTGKQRRLIGAYPRALDGEGARLYLEERKEIDPGRIAVLGMSTGGQAALRTITDDDNENIKGQFRAAIALYPSCDKLPGLKAPALVLLGEADEWVKFAHCRTNFAKLEMLELHSYPGAHHGFDQEGTAELFRGRKAGFDEEASKDAIKRVKAFLRHHLKNDS